MWILRTDAGAATEAFTFRINSGGIRTIGRAVRADFIVDATLVSRLHCRLTAGPSGALEVEDLGSTNGTFVNGQRISRRALGEGDRLRVGGVELVVSRASET
jgi:pSer/pThr/pTyr-binding forkhead associated (FHA) protein